MQLLLLVPPQQINRSIDWYWLHRATIEQSLPLSAPGATYRANALSSIEAYIKQYRAGELSPYLASAYIYRNLVRLRAGLNLAPEPKAGLN